MRISSNCYKNDGKLGLETREICPPFRIIGDPMFLDRIRIGYRIFAGFLALVIMLIGLSALSSWYLLGFGGHADRIAKSTQLVGLANEYALKLERLSNQVLLFAQTVDPLDREGIATIRESAEASGAALIGQLRAEGDTEKADALESLNAEYIATLEPLVLRAENLTAASDTMLLGAHQLGKSAGELVDFISKRDPALAEKYADKLGAANLSAIVNNLQYAILRTPESLDTARTQTSALTDLQEEIKGSVDGLKRADKKLFSYAIRDNDLLKQGANQLEGSIAGSVSRWMTSNPPFAKFRQLPRISARKRLPVRTCWSRRRIASPKARRSPIWWWPGSGP